MANKQSQSRRVDIKSMRSHEQKVEILCVHVDTRGDVGNLEKSIIGSARIKWMAPDKCH